MRTGGVEGHCGLHLSGGARPPPTALVAAEETIAQTRNPEGRIVRLDASTWNHVLLRHPSLSNWMDELMNVIEAPEHREPDARPGRERYFARGGPQKWLRVVTELTDEGDRIVTAFPHTRDPQPSGPAL